MERSSQILLLLASTGCQTLPWVMLPAQRAQESRPASASSAALPSPSPAASNPGQTVCGDAKVEAGESCDDGNTKGGDGCADNCRREPARFLSWDYVLLADGSVVSRKTGQALPGRATLSAPEAAVIKTDDGLRYYYELYAAPPLLPPLPSDATVATLGAGLAACLLNDHGEVWCLGGGTNSDWPRPQFEVGAQVTETGVTLTWYKLRRARGPVAGLAGNVDFGCILLDGGATTQCWRRDTISPKMSLGGGRTARQIVAGSGHVCVLLHSGEIGCWGDSTFGQTGYLAPLVLPAKWPDALLPERRLSRPPVRFSKLDSPAKQLAASDVASCALLENGKLWCWGRTDAFAFEDASEPPSFGRMATKDLRRQLRWLPRPLGASTMPRSPVKLPSGCKVKDFGLVFEQLCVSCEGGCSKCWGQSEAEPNVKAAQPPDQCLTY